MAHETQTLFGKPRVLVQPTDGMAPVRELIDAARVRIVVKMFTFTAASLLDGLIAAQHRGVDVRVMLKRRAPRAAGPMTMPPSGCAQAASPSRGPARVSR